MAQYSASDNRNGGHDWEREVVRDLNHHGYPLAVTSRSSDKTRDSEKVDVINKDEYFTGLLS